MNTAGVFKDVSITTNLSEWDSRTFSSLPSSAGLKTSYFTKHDCPSVSALYRVMDSWRPPATTVSLPLPPLMMVASFALELTTSKMSSPAPASNVVFSTPAALTPTTLLNTPSLETTILSSPFVPPISSESLPSPPSMETGPFLMATSFGVLTPSGPSTILSGSSTL